jgi:pimeloyl-ACP methyl ester carboxylesterase
LRRCEAGWHLTPEDLDAHVHGAAWRGVYDILKKDGFNVSIVQNPTISLAGDVSATKLIIDSQPGPVILVGHSYGGAVITEAATDPNVAGLVYITAFAPDRGESVNTLIANPPPGAIVAAINNARRSEQAALREALAMAKRRDALDAELASFEQRLGSIPRVATADASAAVLSAISGTAISEVELRRFRLALLLGLPLCGGLVLSLAFAIASPRITP